MNTENQMIEQIKDHTSCGLEKRQHYFESNDHPILKQDMKYLLQIILLLLHYRNQAGIIFAIIQ